VTFHARLFDAQGRFVREDKASWALAGGLQGTVSEAGKFVAAMDKVGRAGEIRATVGGMTGAARARVIPPLPWSEDFEGWPVDQTPPHWINTSGKFVIRQLEGSNKVLVKLADNPFTRRARAFNGPSDLKSYTVQVDFFGNEKRRQLGDAGVVAQRYELVLFGSHQRLEIQSWQPERARVVSVPYAWKANTWYRMKLRVEPTNDGKVKALGKVWPVADPEPQAWTIEKVDPIPNLTGSPGLYADAPFEVFFDNYKVSANSCGGRAAYGIRSRKGLADVGRYAGSQHGFEHEGRPRFLGRGHEEKRPLGGGARISGLRQPGCGRWSSVRGNQQRSAEGSEAGGRSRSADGLPRIGRRVPVAAHQ
jgi:hypothetical protein